MTELCITSLCFILLVPHRLKFSVTQSDVKSDCQTGTFKISCCPLEAILRKCRAGIEPPCSPVLPPPLLLLLCPAWCSMIDRCVKMLLSILHGWGAVQQKWFLEGEITEDGLQCRCFYHTQDFFFVIKGAGQVVQKWVSSYSASWHMSHFHFLVWPITLSVIHLLNSPLFFLQNDDGPDVRAGSGDILLVHATETERKGTVWRHLRSLCVFFNRTVC